MRWINADGRDVTQETLDQIHGVMGGPADTLEKMVGNMNKAATINLGSNLTAYNLEAPAKNLYPVQTPLRNKISRVTKAVGAGDAANWREVTAITPGGVKSMPWVPEGQRAARMSITSAPKSASYVTIGLESDVTFEAQSAGAGFEDVLATANMRLLQATMILEEYAILGGNRSVTLAQPTGPSLSTATVGGTIPHAAYNCYVVALTLEGFIAANLASGISQDNDITGMDGIHYHLNGGSSQPSAIGSLDISAATADLNTLSGFTSLVKGAAGYAWFVGTVGAERLEAITTINSVTLTALAGTHQLFSALVNADYSKNASAAFDGLLYAAFNSSLSYFKALPTGVPGVGTPLTSSGHGTIVEIDNLLRANWDNYRLSPDEIYVSGQELQNLTAKVLSGSGTPLVRFVSDITGPNPSFTAGQVVGDYFNPFTLAGGQRIPIRLHPNLPAGTIFAWCQNLPAHYQAANVPEVASIQARRDYYSIPWPIITRSNAVGVYSEEVLKVYFPPALSIISNIGNG